MTQEFDIRNYEPEDLDDESRLQHLGAYVVDQMAARGWVNTPHRIQNSAERAFTVKMLESGAYNWTDEEVEAAVMWTLAALQDLYKRPMGVTPGNIKRLMDNIRGV